jgi:hypothetical protein
MRSIPSKLFPVVRVGILAGVVAAGVLVIPAALPVGAVSPPTLNVTPGPFHNGELINVSVGPNRYFRPYSHVNILECADRGAKKKNLPTSASTCDGNTIQGDTVLVSKNGSFSEHGYQLFTLPNKAVLGELPDNQPVCNLRSSCVLYVGENQENFTWPKVFSRPFVLRNSGRHS